MHFALAIPEILAAIFKLLARTDNARNAQVCHCWSDIALSALWRETDNLRELFAILTPLEIEDNANPLLEKYVRPNHH